MLESDLSKSRRTPVECSFNQAKSLFSTLNHFNVFEQYKSVELSQQRAEITCWFLSFVRFLCTHALHSASELILMRFITQNSIDLR